MRTQLPPQQQAAYGHDAQAAANAYAAVLRSTGFGMCATAVPCPNPPESDKTPPRGVKSCLHPEPPPSAIIVDAYVDTMATFVMVNSIQLLWKITNSNPQIGIETALGFSMAKAIIV